MEDIQDGAIRCKHCKAELVLTDPRYQYSNNSQQAYVPAPEAPTPWFQIVTMIVGLVIVYLVLVAEDPSDKDTIVGCFTFSIIQITLGIGAINASKHGRGMAITGLILGVLSFLIACGRIASS